MPAVSIGNSMLTEQEAEKFANDWIASWNDHDLNRVMAHYNDDVEYSSMFVAKLTNDSSGRIKGKKTFEIICQKGWLRTPN
jgi:ketosteroid isomerase-like protein